MKSRFIQLSFLLFCLLYLSTIHSQQDIFKGIIGTEEPIFYSSIIPSGTSGEAKMSVYFTHSKMDELEVSFWITDEGSAMQSGGPKNLIQGLKVLNNRRPDTIYLKDLRDGNFYSIGLDYRTTSGLSRKFNAKILHGGYRYQYIPSQEKSLPSKAIDDKNQPCLPPDIAIWTEPAGYCGGANKPAVIIQCRNCTGRNWGFEVQVRSSDQDWRPLRVDGERQMAFGAAMRTEPLCAFGPGQYNIKVLAWSDHCPSPVIKTLPSPLLVGQKEPVFQPASTLNATVKPGPLLPDTCSAKGWATLDGGVIRGGLELQSGSPCAEFQPYAELLYLHPGYRDINVSKMPLAPGSVTPFEILLDEKDMTRRIHPVNVTVYVSTPEKEGVPMASFWLRAENHEISYDRPVQPSFNISAEKPNTQSNISARGIDQPAVAKPEAQTTNKETTTAQAESFDENLLYDSFPEVGVTAGDPNCTQIQNLQLVFDPEKLDVPLFISWLSPRCCQEGGCDYTLWAGESPQQLRLLTKGNKPGAIVRELMPEVKPTDEYFEIVVKTSNGVRKAGYVIGEGPKYGLEEILAYHDRIKPANNDPLVFVKGDLPEETGTTNQENLVIFEEPVQPITNFIPCRIARKMTTNTEGLVKTGDNLSISYDFKDKDYRFSLLFQPADMPDEWVIAPGTQQLQKDAAFLMPATPQHTGKYLILTYSPEKNWGCLSAPLDKAVEIKVQ